MRSHEMLQVARYEIKLQARSWSFGLLFLLIAGITFLQVIEQSTGFASFRWELVALPCSMPLLNAYLFNIAQALVLIFIVPELFPSRTPLGTTETLYVRPFDNKTYLFGKLLGVTCWFIIFNLFSMLVCFTINTWASVSPVNPLYYFFYLFTLTIPTLIFISGIMCWLSGLFVHLFFVKILALGLFALVTVYLPGKMYGLLDFTGNALPNVFSDVTGHVALGNYLLHRCVFLLGGVCFAFWGVLLWNRPTNLSERKSLLKWSYLFSLLTLAGWGGMYLHAWHNENVRENYRDSHKRYLAHDICHVEKHAITIEQKEDSLYSKNTLTITPLSNKPLSKLILYLNPGLRVTAVSENTTPLQWERDNQVLIIHRPLAPKDTACITLTIRGNIDERYCNLHLSENQISHANQNQYFYYGQQTAFLSDDFMLLTPTSNWYPTAVAPVDPQNELFSQRDYSRYALKVVNPVQSILLSQGVPQKTNDTLCFYPSNPLSGISLCGGNYEFIEYQGDKFTARLGYFKGHDFFKSYFSQVTQKDLQNNFGWDRCFQYKPVNGWYEEQHPVLFFLETPIPFQTAYRPSLGHGDGVQPGMVLLPERGIGLNMKFIHSLKPNKTGDKPKDPELLEKEVIAIDAFKHRFLQKSFSTSVMNAFIRPFFSNKRAVYYFDDLRMEANPFSCSPMLQGKEDFWIYTPEYPFLNFFFHYWTTQRSLIEKVDDLRGGEDIPYHYLKGKTPRQILYTREKDKQLFHNVLCIMAEDLLARLTVGISRDQFYDFYQEFQQQNGPIVTLEELAIQMQHHTGSNLMSVLKEWYAMPFSAKIQVQDCKLITYNNAKLIRKNTSSSRGNIMEFGMSKIPAYQMKNKTARAKFRNDGSTRGVITVHYSTFGDEGEHHERTFSFFIEPGEAKEISYTGALNNWIINMGTSNFQPVKFSEKSTMKLVKQEQGLVQKEAAPDTSFQIKTIEPTSLDQQITGVFIVDDEDSRFQVENKERILQKLFRKDLGLNSFTYASAMRSDITRWTHQTTGNAYGKYAKSFHYKMGGDGDFKAKWKVNLDKPGKYEIQALLYDNLSIDPENNTIKYHYTIQHKGKKYPVDIELQQEPISSKAYNYQPSAAQLIIPRNGTWVSLGSFDFPSGEVEVILSDKGAASHRIIADAVKWVRVDEK